MSMYPYIRGACLPGVFMSVVIQKSVRKYSIKEIRQEIHSELAHPGAKGFRGPERELELFELLCQT